MCPHIKTYGLLAHPTDHSLSPIIHNTGFKTLKIDAEYRAFDVDNEKLLPHFFEDVRSMPISGLSVSLPYKKAVIQYLDFVDEDAKNIGAVNTIINKNGVLSGYNFDFSAHNKIMLKTLSGEMENRSLNGKKIVILGAGGASRAILYGVLKLGAEVLIANRTIETADLLVEDFPNHDIQTIVLSDFFRNSGLEKLSSFLSKESSNNILINTTSLWLHDKNADLNSLIPNNAVDLFGTIEDIVYTPLKTPLLDYGEKIGKKIITGEELLLKQAVEQFELWTGQKAPTQAMKEALESFLNCDSLKNPPQKPA